MTNRVNRADLEAVVRRINILTGSPLESHRRTDKGYVAVPGHYHLDGAYGGWALHRMHNEGGGIVDVLQVGHTPKAELLRLMHAWIRGYEAGSDRGKQ